MTEGNNQKRRNPRFPVRSAVTGKGPEGREIVGIARDVNANGIFFVTDEPLHQGAQAEITLTLPPGKPFSNSVSLRATGTVVRVETNAAEKTVGIALAFDKIEMSHSVADRH